MTRNIPPTSAHDLLERSARACVAFASDDGPFAQPVVVSWDGQRYLAGLTADAEPRPAADQEVVLLLDEGVSFFDLRALYIRGLTRAAAPPDNAPPGKVWFEIVPLKTVAWDYGQLREEEANEPD